ncbi:hypothetical protein R1flu_027311 [Riccia fluitans]|uniref:Reverse transcriptase Ty1/copia-type domain-containing protein n=1 Tax=Riccia fluitans TaxID=41844 RepID=A0ABD1XIE9_9MARC
MLIATCGVNLQFPHILEKRTVSFINDYSRYMWMYFLHHKSEVFATFVKWKAQVETQIGKKVLDYSRLRVFSCVVYAHTPTENRTKLDPKVKKCYFLGYQQGVKGYRLWDPVDHKLFVNRDVSFNEARSLKEGEKAQAPDIDMGESHPSGIEGEIIHDIDHNAPQEDLPTIVEDVPEPKEHVEEQEGVGNPVDQVDENDNKGDVYALIMKEGEPSSFEAAQNLAEKAKWSATMRKEMISLNDNKTWELVELPKGKQVIACKWVYKRKEGSETGEKIFKARLVAKGFIQRKGVDYNEVFTLVAKYSTIQLLLSLVCMLGLFLDQMDVVIAFLYGVLDEEIFMRQPPGFARKGQESMYVDDMMIVAKDKLEVEKVKAQLSAEFSMKDLGPAKRILGMEIHRDEKGSRLWLTQGNYTRKVLERFNMFYAKPVGTPLVNHFKHQLSTKFCPLDATEKGLMLKVPYKSAVGNLMYLMVCTRPNIAYALGKVSKYNANPGKVHWEAKK